MQFFIGTSAYSVSKWKGSFYPPKLPQKEMLRFYAGRFSTVEINNTFYKFPTESMMQSWAAEVPSSFRFVLKARQSITHFKRLKNAEDQTDDFLKIALLLKKRLGPILFQLPPNFKKDVPRLDAFLDHVAGRARLAFEFRHESWLDDEVFDCLRVHSAALCLADADDLPSTGLVRTANFGYIRLRRESYTDRSLKAWLKKIESQKWKEAFIFFKHEDTGTGPKFAARLLELIGPEPKRTKKK
jgi:uncharacterized protein YecE (DUF72 family)